MRRNPFLIFPLIGLLSSLCAAAPHPGPWIGVHVSAGDGDTLRRVAESVPALGKMGVNALIVQVDYGFQFRSHPELSRPGDITASQARAFGDLCRANGIRVIPCLDCLGHQSWADHTLELLSAYPELDETPGKYPGNKGLYCRSWCPLNPETDRIVFPLIDELIDAFGADAFHVGMDEVFVIGSDDCPRCRGRDPAELFADQVNALHDHLQKRNIEMFLWGDRLLDAKAMGYSRWEASTNGTAPAIDRIPRDIVICDWHYEPQSQYRSIPYFLSKGFRVWPAGWHDLKATADLIDFSREQKNPRMVGYLSTVWGRSRPDQLARFPGTRLAVEKFLAKAPPSTQPAAVGASSADSWPQWRGPAGQGHSDAVGLPVTWSESSHIRFKTEIPGRGWSSPVILGEQVWLTTATENGHSMRAICVDRNSGKIVHNVEVFHPNELEHINTFNSYASPSPVIEPGRLYVCFGTYGSACLDTRTAEPVWKNDQLKINHMEGPGSTPVIYRNLFILQCDGTDSQYVAALDKSTGKLVWKMPRTTPFNWVLWPFRKAYGTPLVIHADGRDQLISQAARRLYSYDPSDGRELWHLDLDPSAYSTAPRPLFADGVVYDCTGFDQAQLWAVRIDHAAGALNRSAVLWKFRRGVPLRSSPILVDGRIYFTSDNGIARCLDAATGRQLWQTRLGTDYSASPIDAEGRIYFFSETGPSAVLQSGPELKILASNELSEGCLATPAVAGSALFVRTISHLYRIENGTSSGK